MSETYVQISGRRLRLTNLEKTLYPAASFTKAETLDYYRRVSSYILPHLKNRCLTLKRYPNGVEGDFFYEKQCPPHRPAWINIRQSSDQKDQPEFCIINDLPSLIWVVNLACLEMHPLLSLADHLDRPTAMVFDLDPGPGRDIIDCGRVGLGLRDMLAEMNLKTFIKTSGGKGLHLYIPLNTPVTFDDTKTFSRAVAAIYQKHHTNTTVIRMSKELRKDRVFIDWSQNDRHKTTVCVYSLRAMPTPTISMPLSWDHLNNAVKEKTPQSLSFTPSQAFDFLDENGDIFEELLTRKQHLPVPK